MYSIVIIHKRNVYLVEECISNELSHTSLTFATHILEIIFVRKVMLTRYTIYVCGCE